MKRQLQVSTSFSVLPKKEHMEHRGKKAMTATEKFKCNEVSTAYNLI